jgi:hypothetical protein
MQLFPTGESLHKLAVWSMLATVQNSNLGAMMQHLLLAFRGNAIILCYKSILLCKYRGMVVNYLCFVLEH